MTDSKVDGRLGEVTYQAVRINQLRRDPIGVGFDFARQDRSTGVSHPLAPRRILELSLRDHLVSTEQDRALDRKTQRSTWRALTL